MVPLIDFQKLRNIALIKKIKNLFKIVHVRAKKNAEPRPFFLFENSYFSSSRPHEKFCTPANAVLLCENRHFLSHRVYLTATIFKQGPI